MITYCFNAARVGPWVCEKAGGQYHSGNPAIGLEYNGQLIAGLYYDGYTGASIAMHSRCDDPRHVTKAFYHLIFDYPFNQLNVKRVTGIVSEANERAQRTNEKLGWKRETTLSDYFPDGNAIVYVMRREDCRWLGVENELQLQNTASVH